VARINKFTDLVVWQKAHRFVLAVYSVSKHFPREEQFGLTSQMRRAAVSVTSNIVEGFDRGSNKEFIQFLIIARASLTEVQSQLLIARDLEYIDHKDFEKLAKDTVEVHKLINGLIKTLRTSKLSNSKTKNREDF
jgi:four helix bundle protein